MHGIEGNEKADKLAKEMSEDWPQELNIPADRCFLMIVILVFLTVDCFLVIMKAES